MKCPKCGNKSKAAGGDQFYYYSDERCTIYHGDCRALLRTLIVSGVGLVVADPPYGMGKTEWDKFDSVGRVVADLHRGLCDNGGILWGAWNA